MLRLRATSIGARYVRVSTCNQARFCSVVEKSPESQAAASKRKAFRQIDLDMKILSRLDTMNVGFLPKRKMRVAVAQKLNPHSYRITDEMAKKSAEEDEFTKAIPFPFRGTGKVLHTASNVLEIPTEFPGTPPEIALIGRSNVGKSTLLNALLGFDNSYVQKAIVSDKPGETKYLTFFQLGMSYKPPPKGKKIKLTVDAPDERPNEPEKLVKTPALMFVDMPGYGFAFMSEEEKLRCHMLCLDYLISNANRNKVLKRVVLLLDGRHGLKASDIMFLQDLQQHLIASVIAANPGKTAEDLRKVFPDSSASKSLSHNSTTEEDHATPPVPISVAAKTTKLLSQHLGWKLQIVLTKCDLVDRSELCRRITDVSNTLSDRLPALYHSMLPTLALSAMQLRGVQEMQRDLAALVPPKWEGAPNNRKPEAEEDTNAIKPDLPHNRGKYATADRIAGAAVAKPKVSATTQDGDRPSFAERRKQREEELTGKVSDAPAPSPRKAVVKDKMKVQDESESEGEMEEYYSSKSTAKTTKRKPGAPSSSSSKTSATILSVDDAPVKEPATRKTKADKVPKAKNPIKETTTSAAKPVKERKTSAVQPIKEIDSSTSTVVKEAKVSKPTRKAAAKIAVKTATKKSDTKAASKKKHHLLEDYSDELDDYFGDDDLEELVDSDFDDSDFELVDGTDDYFGTRRGSAYNHQESDDDEVNWAAAGEYGDDFSDDDDELMEEEMMAGNVNGYRRTLKTTKSSKPKGKGAGKAKTAKPSASASAANTDKEPLKGRGKASRATEGGDSKPAKTVKAVKGDKGGLPRRIPKTPDNPKGRHRLYKPEAATASKPIKPATKATKAPAKPKTEKAPRRKYY